MTYISFSELDYQFFLRSARPEEVVLSILADFKTNSPEKALSQIIQRIEETAKGDFALKKYFNQLRVLAQLRSLEVKLKEAMDSIAQFINEEKDVLYLRGVDKGEEKVVASLLRKLNYSLEQIADIADVSVEFVRSVQQKLSADR
jgi:predicted transposase YdaD